jgi:hypothetical protein
MKKIKILVALVFVSIVAFAQETTITMMFHKIKVGHNNAYTDASEIFINKFFPLKSEKDGLFGSNITGGKHNGEKLYAYDRGKSFADRDIITPYTIDNIRWGDNWNSTVAPHVESIESDVLVYKSDYSNSKFEDRADKALVIEYTIQGIGNRKPLRDILKKYPKVFDKLGWKIAVYTTLTGTDRMIVVRRLPNGWKEFDTTSTDDFGTAYDELYGKGSWDRDAIIVSNWRTLTDRFMQTKNLRLTSK